MLPWPGTVPSVVVGAIVVDPAAHTGTSTATSTRCWRNVGQSAVRFAISIVAPGVTVALAVVDPSGPTTVEIGVVASGVVDHAAMVIDVSRVKFSISHVIVCVPSSAHANVAVTRE